MADKTRWSSGWAANHARAAYIADEVSLGLLALSICSNRSSRSMNVFYRSFGLAKRIKRQMSSAASAHQVGGAGIGSSCASVVEGPCMG